MKIVITGEERGLDGEEEKGEESSATQQIHNLRSRDWCLLVLSHWWCCYLLQHKHFQRERTVVNVEVNWDGAVNDDVLGCDGNNFEFASDDGSATITLLQLALFYIAYI